MSLFSNLFPKSQKFALPVDPKRYNYVGIGINSYRESPLKLCVNDVKALEPYWRAWGLPDANITTLYDTDADTKNIIAALTAAVERANPWDIVVPQYSGHGSDLPCANQRNGRMQIICPSDIEDDFERNNVPDTFFADLGRKATAKRVTIIMFPFDCCHTGGLTRTLNNSSMPPLGTPRYLPAPEGAKFFGEVRRYKDDGAETSSLAMVGGCRAEEVSYEYADAGHGACTWGVLEALKKGNPYTLRTMHQFAYGKVTSTFPAQHPVLEGNEKLFDLPLFSPMPY